MNEVLLQPAALPNGQATLSAEQEAALAAYWRVRGDPKKEQEALLELRRLNLVLGHSVLRG